MATSAQFADAERYDVRTIVGGGVTLGAATAVGVVLFALLSRVLEGNVETVVRSGLILVGGAVASYFPAASVRPRSAETIAWAATLGLLGSFTFTLLDVALLRPLNVYHWTWDAIGGGSGFWYISVWWMGSAVLAWLGAWAYARAAWRSGKANIPTLVGQTIGITILLFAVLVGIGLLPFHSAIMALAFALALVAQVPLAAMHARR
jgi:hypothetical protein